MNIQSSDKADLSCIAERRQANDAFQRCLTGGTVRMTASIQALGDQPKARIESVRTFDAFGDDDPCDNHALGDFEIAVEQPGAAPTTALVFFRIDYGPPGTGAILTLMLASERRAFSLIASTRSRTNA